MLKSLVRATLRRTAVRAIAASLALAGAAAAQTPVPIAAIQASPATYSGTEVTVEGVVTVPINYRGPTPYTGYIQDASGRGINLFGGSTAPPNAAALNTIGNRVRVTGEVTVFSVTTVEILNITAVTSLGPATPVTPIRVSTQAANDARWEGTYIEVAGTVQSSTVTGGARNYVVSDGSGTIVARVYETNLGVPVAANGTAVIARGAGTNFQGTYQFYVGAAADFVQMTPPADTTPPPLVGTWSPGATSVVATFGEALQAASGQNTANYQVSEAANPSNVVPISSIALAGPVATLTLGANLAVQTDYRLEVVNVQDLAGNTLVSPVTQVFRSGGMLDTTPPSVASASAPSATSVAVTFSESIAAASGGQAANYTVYETANMTNTVPVTSASVSGSVATLTLGASLAAGGGYTVRAQSIADLAGNVMPAPQTATFTAPGGGGTCPGAVTIASIQANPVDGAVVTVQGQVYIPSNYRGTTFSGYIQDASGRGINVFGNTANDPRLQDVGNVVCITGTVDIFFTTVEITSLTSISVVSSGNPPLTPVALSTGAAANAQWEGTFIQVTGNVVSSAVSGPGRNYTINDGSGPIDVRVVDTLSGVPVFANGTRITARGAGSQFSTTFQVLVGRTTDVFEDSGGSDTTPPSVTNATAPTATQVTVTFNEPVTTATGNNAANYAVFETANPSVTIPVTSAALAGDRRSANLALGASLVDARSYTVRVSNLQDDAGNAIVTPQTRTFTRGGGPVVTPIATIQANPAGFDGMVVTVEGQVYIPSNYRGSTISGYIQDASGRGINLFGTGANVPAAQNTGNIIRVTGEVELFFTTVEITNISNVTLVSSGNPPLQPTPLATGDAASSQWEGTYILVTGEILAIVTQTAAINYTVNDGSGPVVVRVVSTVPAPTFSVGQTITARGAGSQFQSDFQILVGQASAIFEGPPPDTFPPAILAAAATGAQEVTVTFNEPLDAATAQVAANYEVFRTNDPSSTIAVTGATLSGASAVRLALGGTLNVALGFTVRVRNVEDLLGNAISALGIVRAIEEPRAEVVAVSGPPFTFLPRRGETYPVTISVPTAFATGNGEVLLRIFDLQGRLKKTLFDSRFDRNAFVNNRVTRAWDGRDDVAEIVPAGTYVVHLLVVGAQSGDRREAQMPVVVATRLSR